MVAISYEWCGVLRHIREQAQGLHSGDLHDRAGRTYSRGALRNQMARVNVAPRHNPVERRGDHLVLLHRQVLFQGGSRLEHVRMLVVEVLARYDAVVEELPVAVIGHCRQVVVGASVGDLLIGLGRVNDSDNLTGPDTVALVNLDLLHVAGNLRKDVGLVEAAQRRWQLDVADRRSMHDPPYQDVHTHGVLACKLGALPTDPEIAREYQAGSRDHHHGNRTNPSG